ncbi:hypothetical protein PGT21_027452 [Puccinia graminis f. sp. tritici]|uniref:Uncharacterized protein n=1 Tax=Puccinia graminis f. sp. tritici TaxID=56615 RepID=A0A5B0M7V6_PUCGR|nr:hypothetical protein PGT21_027452 [Puccinia graminis f. sp. tritici]KAA1135199.1 hypothetical protein PGTUg99_012766 [Puccinia graminis f. sp. tritici]
MDKCRDAELAEQNTLEASIGRRRLSVRDRAESISLTQAHDSGQHELDYSQLDRSTIVAISRLNRRQDICYSEVSRPQLGCLLPSAHTHTLPHRRLLSSLEKQTLQQGVIHQGVYKPTPPTMDNPQHQPANSAFTYLLNRINQPLNQSN